MKRTSLHTIGNTHENAKVDSHATDFTAKDLIMRNWLVFFMVFFVFSASAQNMDDRLSTLPSGTILILKNDYLIQPFESTITIESDDSNYGVFNLVFDSKDSRRRMRAGTEFVFDRVEVQPRGLKLMITDKINYVYFGDVLKKDDLKISALLKVFDVEFPGIEDF